MSGDEGHTDPTGRPVPAPSTPDPVPQAYGRLPPPPQVQPGQPTNPYATPAPGAATPPTTGPGSAYAHPYGQVSPGMQPPPGYLRAAAPRTNVSAVVLLVVSIITALTCLLLPGIGAIFAIVALSKNADDPAGSRRIARWGWVAWAVAVAVVIVGVVVLLSALPSIVDSGHAPTPFPS